MQKESLTAQCASDPGHAGRRQPVQDESGRVSQIWPFALRDDWCPTKTPDIDDFIFHEEVGHEAD